MCYYYYYCYFYYRAVLISVSIALSQTPATTSYKSMATVSLECLFSSQFALVPIYTPWWTESHVCEQLAQGRYVEQSSRDLNLCTLGCYTFLQMIGLPQFLDLNKYAVWNDKCMQTWLDKRHSWKVCRMIWKTLDKSEMMHRIWLNGEGRYVNWINTWTWKTAVKMVAYYVCLCVCFLVNLVVKCLSHVSATVWWVMVYRFTQQKTWTAAAAVVRQLQCVDRHLPRQFIPHQVSLLTLHNLVLNTAHQCDLFGWVEG